MEVVKVEKYQIEMSREEIEYIISLYKLCLSESIGPDDTLGVIRTLSDTLGISLYY